LGGGDTPREANQTTTEETKKEQTDKTQNTDLLSVAPDGKRARRKSLTTSLNPFKFLARTGEGEANGESPHTLGMRSLSSIDSALLQAVRKEQEETVPQKEPEPLPQKQKPATEFVGRERFESTPIPFFSNFSQKKSDPSIQKNVEIHVSSSSSHSSPSLEKKDPEFTVTPIRNYKITVNFAKAKITKLLAPLGGSGARVYGCDVDGLQCVLKEFQYETKPDQSAIEKFQSEIQIIESLAHPNIVKYLCHLRKRNSIQMFISRYENSLRNEIRTRESEVIEDIADPYYPKEILLVLRDVARGLCYLHKNNILHRDLKSDNIFVNYGERGNISRAVIGDFDTAKRMLTDVNPRTVVGTTNYMAPEVLQLLMTSRSKNEGCYTYPADIWSLGVVGFELVTLRLPYASLKHTEAVDYILKGQRPPLPSETPSEYEQILELLNKCTVLNPEERPTGVDLCESISRMIMES
jgi:hypothetical protein